jgi:hypothetical protein
MKRRAVFILAIVLVILFIVTNSYFNKKLQLDSFIEEFYLARSECNLEYLQRVTVSGVFEKIEDDNFVLNEIIQIYIIEKSHNRYLIVVSSYGHEAGQIDDTGYFYSDEITIEWIDGEWIITKFGRG